MAKKYYVVWEGNKRGVFHDWESCKASIDGYKGAQYKSFESYEMAKLALENKGKYLFGAAAANKPQNISHTIILDSLAVDAACSGNPGPMEYRGVYVKNKAEIFRMGPFLDGTNNVGEFLALVHGLAYLKKMNSSVPIYSDSQIAIGWIKNKKCNTKLQETKNNEELILMIDRAEEWLQKNSYSTIIYKWDTKNWGEIPADFGRK